MKIFQQRRDPEQSEDQEIDNGRGNKHSSSWLGKDPVDSSIFDSVTPPDELPAVKIRAPQQTLAPAGDSLSNPEDDTGYDPYNTGRFVK